jgi:hypothetical protein
MAKHKVKTHRWFNGALETLEHFFETFEDALEFAESAPVHITKIYDETNMLVDSVAKKETEIEISYSGYETNYSGYETNYSGYNDIAYA